MRRLPVLFVRLALWCFDVGIFLTVEESTWEELRTESREATRRAAAR